jgi:hypothetical protein
VYGLVAECCKRRGQKLIEKQKMIAPNSLSKKIPSK